MKTKTQFTNRILSLVLSIMMVVSMLPMNILTANAAETTESAIDELLTADHLTEEERSALMGSILFSYLQ